jgi:hypothetical protein
VEFAIHKEKNPLQIRPGTRILDNTYPVVPAHPIIPLALRMVKGDEQTAAFLRDYSLRRLPASYTPIRKISIPKMPLSGPLTRAPSKTMKNADKWRE